MELNTSGLYKNYPEMNPGPTMLHMMRERGIPVVVGSDSHRSRRGGGEFVRALNALQSAGYTEGSGFKNRKRTALPIATVLPQVQAAVQQPDDLGLFAARSRT